MTPHYNFADLFELAAAKVPGRTAIVDDHTRITYADLDERTDRLAHALLDAGVRPGDHVGIFARNCVEWAETMFALYKMRAVPVNVNYRYVEDELRYLFGNADMVAVVYQQEYGPLIARSRDAQPRLARFFRIDDGSGADDAALVPVGYEEAVAAGSPAKDLPERSGDDIYLLYTGGTTGKPKGVMWRQEDVFFALGGGIDAFTNVKVTSPTALSDKIDPAAPGGLVFMPVPPLMHGAGQFGTFRALFEGNTVVYVEKFDADRVWDVVQRERVNVVSVTGDAMARPLADALERRKDDLDVSSIVSFGSTAAIFSYTVKQHLKDLLPEYCVMTDAIGSTESGMNGIRTVEKGDGQKEGITTVQASADSTVLDDDLRPVEPGSGVVGKLARGGNIPLGYYNDPEKTAATFVVDAEGRRWSIPGDFATIEADGRITLLGRGSVSINSGGEKIYPEEVEQALKSHPDVFDVIVVGVPDERWGERVTALLQPREGRAPSLDALREHCREHLAGYKLPREVFVVEQVPRLENGKPDYRTAKSTALELVGATPA